MASECTYDNFRQFEILGENIFSDKFFKSAPDLLEKAVKNWAD